MQGIELKPISFDRWIDCAGKALSIKLLKAQLADAIEREDYKDAAAIRDRIEYLQSLLSNKQ